MIKLMQGDCLEMMKQIPNWSVDMILTDPPYGTTACKWDAIIPLDLMWKELKRVIYPGNKAIAMTASQPFTTILAASNMANFKYVWYWDKKFAGNFVQAKRMPLKVIEEVLIFSFGKHPQYFPQMTKRDIPIKKGGNKQSVAIPIKETANSEAFGKSQKTYKEKHPTTLIQFNVREGRGLHPTQKPVALMEYLIEIYTKEEETVLDFTMGSGTTGVACKNLNRNFIGIELDKEYFRIAKERIEQSNKEQE